MANKTNSLNILITFLLNMFLFLIIFDILRNGIYLPDKIYFLISFVRDGLVFLLLLLVVYNRKVVIHSHALFLILLLFPIPMFLMAISGFGEIDFTLYGLYQQSRGIIFFLVLINLSDRYLTDKTKLVKYLILGTLFLFVVVIVIYTQFSHLIVNKYMSFRVGVGNQAAQSAIYIFGLILCLHYQPFKRIANIIISLFLIIASILSGTGTAIVIVMLILLISLFEYRKRKVSIPIIFFMMLVCGIVLSLYWSIIEVVLIAVISKLGDILDLFFKYITFSNESIKSVSFSIRENQIQRMFDNLEPAHLLFGSGRIAFQYPEERMIENAFISILHDRGILGFCLVLALLIPAVINSFSFFFRYKETSRLMVVIFVFMYALTLEIISTILITTLTALLCYFIFVKKACK